MRRPIFLSSALLGAAALGLFWWLTATPFVSAVTASARTPDLANGLTTFNAGGCSSCHAVPGQPDRMRLGGGLAIPSPFGTFYAPNISPDPADGIGRWTEAEFVTAVTKGISPAGFHYFPAFPYTSYQHAKVEDVRDLFAYLKTLAPVSGKVRDHDLPFPFSVRRNIGIWKLLFMDGKAFRAGRGALGELESRRLSRWRPRALRRVSQSPEFPRRHYRSAAPRRRTQSRRRGLGAEHHPKRDLATGARRTSPISSRPANCPMATAPADRWRA